MKLVYWFIDYTQAKIFAVIYLNFDDYGLLLST